MSPLEALRQGNWTVVNVWIIAAVFGLAALAGFFAFRTFKNAQSVSAPPIQPTYNHQTDFDESLSR